MVSVRRNQKQVNAEPARRVPVGLPVVFVLSFALATGIYLFKDRQSHPDAVSGKILEAVLAGDVDAMYDHSIEKDRKLEGFSRNSLKRVYDQIVHPSLSKFRVRDPIKTAVEGEGGQGVASTLLALPDGRTLSIASTPVLTDNGVKAPILLEILTEAWVAEEMVRSGKDSASVDGMGGRIRGLERDMPFLKSLGLKSFVGIDPTKKPTSFERMLAFWKKHHHPQQSPDVH